MRLTGNESYRNVVSKTCRVKYSDRLAYRQTWNTGKTFNVQESDPTGADSAPKVKNFAIGLQGPKPEN